MTYERRKDPATRDQYKKLSDCLACEGEVKGCELYITVPTMTNQKCGWYQTLQLDKMKLQNGNKYLTFPLLEKILEDQK